MTRQTRFFAASGDWIPWLRGLLTILFALVLLGGRAATPEPVEETEARDEEISGRVQDSDGAPVADVTVLLRETGSSARTDGEGRFTLGGLAAGTYTLELKSDGYVPQERTIELATGDEGTAQLVTLVPIPRFLTEVVVTPSLYSLYAKEPEMATSLSREEVDRLPRFADDVFRAARWLPGASGEDFSSLMNVRGGAVDETLVLVDGLEVHEAFHLKELFSVQSVIDSETVEGLEFMSGGFPVDYGNRMSGVINISSSGSGPQRTTLTATTSHLGLLSQGPFATERGRWLLSGRRTNLDNVIRFVDPGSGLEPLFYDVLGKISYNLGKRTVVSGHILGSWDRTHYVEQNGRIEELLDASSSSRYAWLNLATTPASRLFMETVLSAGHVERERDGWIDYWHQEGFVDDERRFNVFTLKQDWSLDLDDRHLLKWGFELGRLPASYDFRSHVVVRDGFFVEPGAPRVTDRNYSFQPRGNVYAVYAADRLRLAESLVAEAGLRWDSQTYVEDHQLSPRLNLVYTLGNRTTLRGAWGLYHQTQQIHELQVSDGITDFQPAQRSQHRLLSLEHHLPGGFDLRVELYQKKLTDVRAYYENLFNPIEIFPEIESDRILVAPDRSDARGIEVMLRQDDGPRWSWWLSYAYARAQDEIDGEWVPRSWDQPHSAAFSLNYRPGERWNLNLSGLYHTGWPTTAIHGEVGGGPEQWWVRPYAGPRNGARMDDYLRIDLRASRSFEVGPGSWSLFVEVMNLLNRANLSRPEGADFLIGPDGSLEIDVDYEQGLPILPSLGLRWTF